MAKEVAGFIKLQIKGGAANPSPPASSSMPELKTKQVKFYRLLSLTMQISHSLLLLKLLRLPCNYLRQQK